MIELLIGGAVVAAGAGVETLRRLADERQRRAEILRRHQTAMRIDRIRRQAEDDLLRAAGVIDSEAVEEDW